MRVPLVSVIICSYNGKDRIKRAIQSVLNQTMSDFELVVIDDGSIESIEDTVRECSDNRIRFFRSGKNRGLHATRKWGVELSKGEFIAILDDDDEWVADKLEKQIRQILSAHEVGLVCGGAIDYYPDGVKMLRLPPGFRISYKRELVEECTIASSVLFRRSVYESVGGFDSSLRRCGDWDCWIRVARCSEIRCLLEPIVHTHMRRDSLQRSPDIEGFGADRWRVLEKHADELTRLNLWHKAVSRHYHSIGVRYLRSGNFVEAQRCLQKALNEDLNLDTLLAWVAARFHLPEASWERRALRRIKTEARKYGITK